MADAAAKLAPATSPPIVHTTRDELREAVNAELAAMGCPEPLSPASGDECVTMLVANPDSVLVLDWSLGSPEVNRILGSIKGHFHVETRPIFLIISELDDDVILTGAEYGVSQMHAGPLSRLTIRECLQALFDEDQSTRSVREVLVQVADLRARGEWSMATPLLVGLWERQPDNERAVTELAENLIHEGNWERAAEMLEPFAAAEPPSVRAIHLTGRCLMQKGDSEAAIAMLQRAKIINPHNVDRLIDLGNALLRNDQVAAARAEFEEAAKVAPGSKDAAVGKSQCLLMTGEVNEALRLLKAISGPREMASVFNTAAVLSIRAGRFDKGMKLYQSALKALGKDQSLASRLFFNMGLGYKRWSKPDKALQCFQRSVELDPGYAKAIRHKTQMENKVEGIKDDRSFSEEEFTSRRPAVDSSRLVELEAGELETEGSGDDDL